MAEFDRDTMRTITYLSMIDPETILSVYDVTAFAPHLWRVSYILNRINRAPQFTYVVINEQVQILHRTHG